MNELWDSIAVRALAVLGVGAALLTYLRTVMRDRAAARQHRYEQFTAKIEAAGRGEGLADEIAGILAEVRRTRPNDTEALLECAVLEKKLAELRMLIINWNSKVMPEDREMARVLGLMRGGIAQLEGLKARLEALRERP